MEEDQIQEFKHACKFCNKSFPCGRSLGGHMRSHINNLSAEKTEQKQKLSIKINNGSCIGSEAATNGSYGLRENPKKTWRKRVADSSEDSYVYDKFCKECGKSFHSWQALFGHMKCHSEKERVSNSLEDQDSWTNNAKDVQSDNEITAPNKKKRSKRTRIRCNMEAAATVTASSSVSEVGHEQEEVAMSLIMLSRDVSPWSGLHSLAAESSDNNSVYFEARSSVRTNLVTKFDADIAKLMKQSEKKKYELSNSVSKKFNFKGKSSELLDTEKGFRMIKTGVSIKGFLKSTKSELDYVSTLEDSEVENGKSRVNGTESAISKSATIKSSVNKPHHHLEDEFIKNFSKRGKFECTTCNKIFHSYQALGGHRASHKKNKGCFASKIESSENSIEFETDLSHDHEPATESKLMKISENNIEYVQNIAETVRDSKKKIKGHHECPICFKVFQSGQALGGHKRSHMVVAGSESRVVREEQVPQIRDFLDLNLPAATEEESNSHADSNRPWWILEGNHNQEALVG